MKTQTSPIRAKKAAMAQKMQIKSANPNSPGNYAKAMQGAYTNAEKKGKLGRGFGQ